MSIDERRPDPHGDPQRSEEAALDRAWREASREEPPAPVDAAILAAARAAVAPTVKNAGDATHEIDAARGPGRSRAGHWFTRWQSMAAAAAVAGLALLLVPRLPQDVDAPASRAVEHQESMATTEPLPQEAAPAPEPPSRVERRERSAQFGDMRTAAPTEPVPLPTVPPPPPAAPAPPAADAAPSVSSTASPAEALASGAATHEHVMEKARRTSPADRATHIAALHEAGDLAAAARELRAFRADVPDADDWLPEALRTWARTVED